MTDRPPVDPTQEEPWQILQDNSGPRQPTKHYSELFLLIATGNKIHPEDLELLDGCSALTIKNIADNEHHASTSQSHSHLYFVDNKGQLLRLDSGLGFRALTCQPVTSIDEKHNICFSPRAQGYLESHPELIAQPEGRLSACMSSVRSALRRIFLQTKAPTQRAGADEKTSS